MEKCENIPKDFCINEANGCFFESVAQVLAQIKPSELNITGGNLFKECIKYVAILQINQLSLAQAKDVGQIVCKNYNIRLHIIQIQNKDGKEIWTHHWVDKHGAIASQCNYKDDDTIHILCKGDFHFKPVLRSLESLPKTSSQLTGDPKQHEQILNAIKSNALQTLKELLNLSPEWLLDRVPFLSQAVDDVVPKMCEQFQINGPLSSEMHSFFEEAFGLQHLFVSMARLSKSCTTENELLDVICTSLETFKKYADYFLVQKGLTHHRMNLLFFSLIAEKYERWMEIRLTQQNCVEISRKTLKEIQLHLTKLLFPLHEYNKIFVSRDKLRQIRLEFLKSNEHPFSCWEVHRNSVNESDEINTIYRTYRFGRSQFNLVSALSAAFEAVSDKTLSTTQAKVINSPPYLIMKDIYVLDRILHYIDLALPMDLKNKSMSYIDQLVLERALQVTGEYVKNTDETPNLSEEIQMKLTTAGVQIKLLTEVRNVLSHFTSKEVFSEKNENAVILLENVHKDLEKVRGVILKVLRQVKIQQIQNLLCFNGLIQDNKSGEVVQQIKQILEDIKQSMSKQNIKLAFEKLMNILKSCSLIGDIETSIHEILCVILPDIIQERLQMQNEKLVTKSDIFQKYDDQKFGIYDHEWTDCKSVISKISSLKEIEKFRKSKITGSDKGRNLHGLKLADIFVKVIMEKALLKKDFKAIIQKLKFGFEVDLDTVKLKEKNNSPSAFFLDAVGEIVKSKLDDQLNYFLEKYLNDCDSNELLRLMNIQEQQQQAFRSLLNEFRVHAAKIAKPTQILDDILTRALDSISKMTAKTPEANLTEECFQILNAEVENKRNNRIAKIKLTILCGGINKVRPEEFSSLVSKLQGNVKEKEWEQCYKNRRKCKITLDREVNDPYDKLVNAMEKGLDLNGMKQCFIHFIEGLQITPASAATIFARKTANVIEEIFEENFEKQFNDTMELARKLQQEIASYDGNEVKKEYLTQWKTNERLKAALEMVILKALNTLSAISTPKLCKKLEKLIHATAGRLLGNKMSYTPLRNYLAHGDAMIDMRNENMQGYLRVFADILIQNGRAILAVNKMMSNPKNCSFLRTILSDQNLTRIVEQNPEICGKEIPIIMESEYWKNCLWKTDLINMLKEEDAVKDAETVANLSFSEFLRMTDRELRTAISFGDLRGTQFFLNHSQLNRVEHYDNLNFLHLAAENGSLDVLRFLLKQGFVVNATNQIHYTPLHFAVLNQNTEAARCLLVHEANARAKDDHGYTPLHIAAYSGTTDIILLLIQYGANVQEASEFKATPLLLAVWNGHVDATRALITAGALVNMPEDYLTRLACLAADEGHDQIIQALINGGVKVGCSMENAWTPLHQATRKGHLNVVNAMIDNGADVSVRDAESITPLHLARSASIAERLIKAGADVNCLSNFRTPLHVAVAEGASQVVELLLGEGANIEARIQHGWLASHIAAMNGHVHIMRLLIEAGASVNAMAYINTNVRRKVTPLYLACLYGHSDMVELLLQHNVNADDISCETLQTSREDERRFEWPLQIAIAQQYFEMADTLLEHGVDVTIVDDNGLTALHYAAYYGPPSVVKKLLEKKANVNAVTKDNMTPIYSAIMTGSCDIIQLLIDQGADLDHKTEGDTILHFAVRHERVEVVDLLLRNGFSSNAEGQMKRTALHLVCRMESEDENASNQEMLRLFLDHTANVNAADLYNDTPLHFAAKKGDIDSVKVLIMHGANPSEENLLNTTPLQLAKQFCHDECYALMQNLGHKTSNGGKDVNLEHTRHRAATSDDIRNCSKTLSKTAETWIANLCKEVVTSGDLKAVQELLPESISLNVDLDDYQLLHICVLNQNGAVMKALLDHGLNVNYCNRDGLTPLHLATQTKNREAVCSLLKTGADVNGLTRNTMQSALHIAVENEAVDILELLLDSDNVITDYKNSNDETPLMLACQTGHLDIVNLLINHKAQLNEEDGDQDAPIHVAAKYNRPQIIQTLLTRGANARAIGKMGNHPLHYSMNGNTMLIPQMLIDHGADVNCVNVEHFTPLHVATREGNETAVEFLLNKGIKVDGIGAVTDSPLHLAVDERQWKIMELLIKNKANVNAKNGQKQTVLHLAAIKGDYAMVELLLGSGANAEIADERKCTPLYLAVEEGHYGIVQLLTRNGACVNAMCKDGWAIIHQAVRTSDVAIVEEVLKYGGSINCPGKDGWTPLHLAIGNDCHNIAKLLIDREANINVPDNANEFPIHLACKSGNDEITEMLIKAGANVNCCNEKGITPLITAIRNQSENCIKVLLENDASVDSVSFHGQRLDALEAAMANMNMTAVTLLIENGADINSTKDGLSFMHSAVCYGSAEILEKLHRSGLNVDARGNDDDTPLHFAVTAGHVDCVRYLLGAGADINATTRKNGDTPLSLALSLGKREIAGILIANGANSNVCYNNEVALLHLAAEHGYADIIGLLLDNGADVNQKNHFGSTALHYAVVDGHLDAVKVLLRQNDSSNSSVDRALAHEDSLINTVTRLNVTPLLLAILKGFDNIAIELIERGANVNLTYDNGTSPLMAAITKKLPNVVRCLIKHGTVVNAANSQLHTALHIAINENSLEIVQYLWENGADIHVKLEDGGTLLHFAAFYGNAEIIRHLLKFGLDVNAISNHGKTPLHVAAYQGCIEAVHVLLENGANVNAIDNSIRTPLHFAALGEAAYCVDVPVIESARKKEEFFSVAKSLIRNGVFVDATDENSETALHIAANLGSIRFVTLLLESANANGNVDVNANTPLHLAAENGHAEIIRLLLDKGVAVDQQTDSGMTALCSAAYNGHLEAVKTLLHHGASKTPILHIAALNGNVQIIQLILGNLSTETNLESYVNASEEDGFTPLSIAALGGHEEATELLLLIGAEVNSRTKPPLHCAAKEGHVDILELLLNRTCKLDQKDENGNTALHVASSNGHLNAVKLLLGKNARERRNLDNETKPSPIEPESEEQSFIQNIPRCKLSTNLQINQAENNACSYKRKMPTTTTHNFIDNLNDRHLTALLAAIIEKHEDIAIALIEAGADVNKADDNGDSPLMFAILKHLPNVVHELTKHGADINALNGESGNALHFAINENNLDVLLYLEENGANMDVRLRDGSTLLHHALSSDKNEMISHLLKFGLVNIANTKGRTPLHFASYKGFSSTVTVLLQNGAEVNAKDASIRTSLHDVVLGMSENTSSGDAGRNAQQMDGFLLTAKSLILQDADVNATDENNQTALHYAIYFGYKDFVELLLHSKANVNGNAVEGCLPPLHSAAENGYNDIIKLLIDKDAYIDEVDEYGLTALSKAVRKGLTETVKTLLQCGASTSLNFAPFSILHAAAFSGNMATIKLILENLLDETEVGKEVNGKDKNGNSPLMYASECGHLKIAELLLTIGADVNAVNNNCWSALHWAANLGLINLVLTLLDYGSDVNLKCKSGSTALYLSACKGHLEVVDALLRNNASATGRHGHDTILHVATNAENPKILKIILDKLKRELRFDDYLNAQDTAGDTPLMWAAEGGNLEAAKTLLQYGARADVKNKDGVSAMDWAYKKGHHDIIDLFKKI